VLWVSLNNKKLKYVKTKKPMQYVIMPEITRDPSLKWNCMVILVEIAKLSPIASWRKARMMINREGR
jgi:hypothetical protein